MRRLIAAAVIVFAAGVLRAGELVPGFDDSRALADFTAAHAGVDGADTADITSGRVTLAARFNPDASQASGGPVIVIEVGGTTNGTGLYIGDGQLFLAAKYASTTGIATSMNDTDFSDGVLAVTLGEISFGAENTVYASLNVNTGELIYSINGTGGYFTISNTSGNEDLDGNHSVSFLGSGAIVTGHMGGLTDSSAAPALLFRDNVVNMVQTAGYSNQRGQVFEAAVPKEVLPYSIIVSQSNGSTDVREGGAADTISIVITDYPGSYPLTVSLSEFASQPQLFIEPSEVVFKSSNWSNPQEVAVTAIDDDAKEARRHAAAISFNVQVDRASDYYGTAIDELTVTVSENDCEVWGYDSFDINQDCQLDLADLSHIIAQWLECTLPVSGCADYRP
jgi:hypothetical protein